MSGVIGALVTMPPAVVALIATTFTWGMTALGAALVFFFKKTSQLVMDSMMGFAAGIMVAASFFSLLLPGMDYARTAGLSPALTSVAGFAIGCAFLFLADKIVPHTHDDGGRGAPIRHGGKARLGRSSLMILAIVLHNIPEGLAVGVAIGAAASAGGSGDMMSAVTLAIGIGIQNFPEGAAVSLPARRDGLSRGRAFWYGQLSGAVEPVSAVVGTLLVTHMTGVLPFAMSFAAGAMIYVVFDELIPTAHENGRNRMCTLMAMAGFAIMMLLDLALG